MANVTTSLGFSIFSKFNREGVQEAERAISSLDGKIRDTNSSFRAAAGQANGLTVAAMALAPAMGTIGAVAVAAGTAAAASMGVAGVAVGAYGMVLSKTIERTMEQKEAGEKLTASQAKFIQSTEKLTTTWNKFLAAHAPQTLSVARDGIDGLTAGIGRLNPLMDATHPIIKRTSEAWKAWMQGDGSKRFVDSIIKNGVPALNNFMLAGRNLLAVFGEGFRTVLPLSGSFSEMLLRGSKAARDWSESGGFSRFMEYVKDNKQIVIDFFKALAAALWNVSNAVREMAPSLLTVVTALLSFVAALPTGAVQAFFMALLTLKVLVLLTGWVGQAVAALRILAFAFGIGMGPIGLIIAAIGALITAIIWIATQTTWFQDAWRASWEFIKKVASAVIDWFVRTWAAVWDGAKKAVVNTWAWIQSTWESVTGAIVGGGKSIASWFESWWNPLWDGVKSVAMAVWSALTKAWSIFVEFFLEVYRGFVQPVIDAFKNVWPELVQAVKNSWGLIIDVIKWAWGVISGYFEWVWGIILPILEFGWKAISKIFEVSFGMLWAIVKAGWDVLVTIFKGVWGVISAVVEFGWAAVVAVFTTVWDIIVAGLRAFGTMFLSIWEPIWDVVKTVFVAIWEILKAVWRTFVDFIEAILLTFLAFFTGNWSKAWDAIKAYFESVWNFIKTFFEQIWNVMKALFVAALEHFVNLWEVTWQFIKDVFVALWDGVREYLTAGWEFLKAIWFNALEFLKNMWEAIWTGIKNYFTALWDGIKDYIVAALDFIKNLWETVWTAVSNWFQDMWLKFGLWLNDRWEDLKRMFDNALNWIKNLWETVWTAVRLWFEDMWLRFGLWLNDRWEDLKKMFDNALNWIKNLWETVWTAVRTWFEDMWLKFGLWLNDRWEEIKEMFSNALNAINTKWTETWNNIVQWFTDKWNGLISWLGQRWEDIKNIFSSGGNWLMTTFWQPLETFFTQTIPNAFSRAVDFIRTAWEKVKEAVKAPIQWVVDVVYNNGIRKMWNFVANLFSASQLEPVTLAKGGPVKGPGTTTSDSIPARLSRDEHVWTAREVRAAGGHDAVAQIRSAVLGGQRVRSESNSGMYAEGGGVFDWLGDAFNDIQTAVRGEIYKKVKPPAERLKNAGIGKVNEIVPGNNNGLEQLARGVVSKPIDTVLEWIKASDTYLTGGVMNWQDMWGLIKRNFADATLTSGYRAGDPGYHGKGNAIDVAWGMNSHGKGRMMDVNRWIATNFSNATELIHTPGINLYQGKPHTYSAATRNEHYDHVHWAQASRGWSSKGGELPQGMRLNTINHALGAAGIQATSEWQRGLNTLITRESNWNPWAINNWDSNAKKGTPSKGLCQVIDPTFQAYRVGSLPNDPFHPQANIAAASRYIVRRYGHITNVQQADASKPPKGYFGGTFGANAGIGYAAEKGMELITRGPTPRMFRGGEKVWNNKDTMRALTRDGGSSGDNVEINIDLRGATAEAIDKFKTEAVPKLKVLLNKGTGKRHGG